jgi:two-component system CheB/CheR fusion protein
MAKDKKVRGAGKTKKPLKDPSSTETSQRASLSEQTLRIVAMGASAGGLEAFQQFFKNMPPDSGMAFVLVQHLDPGHPSAMTDILSRQTKMPVYEATDGMKVEANSIYLIPPNKFMGITNGVLYLQEPIQPHGLRLPIDFFFRSLAKEKGQDAIGIVLSGTGTDGTLGLRAIKADLGTVMVQDPESARYDGMPRNAIDTGLADFVLTPEKMPGQLIQFVKHSVKNGAKTRASVEEQQEVLQKIFAILKTQTGHDFSRYKQATIKRRIERRMSVNQIDDISDYASFIRGNPQEVKALIKDILISVTNFFRDPEAFDSLKGKIKDLINNKTPGSDFRVWVAGCATGEEAYSVAMTVVECMEEADKHFLIQIFATDIDTDALNVARAGIYPANIAADITSERLKRFFVRQEGSFRISKELREMVIFAPHNFIKDPPFSKMDLVCCRNLLIYLEVELQKRLLPLLHYALKPGGIMFLGPSESVGEFTDLFTVVDKKYKIYQRREVPFSYDRVRFPAMPEPVYHPGEKLEQPVHIPEARIPLVAEKIFLDNYAPTFAIIDDKHRIVYVRGRTGRYLELTSGEPSLSILDMARQGLRTELASAVYRAASEKKPISYKDLMVKHNSSYLTVNLTVAPLTDPGLPPGLLMVVFQDVGQAPEGAAASKRAVKGRKHALELEDELKLTKENLQATIEELEATNEELKSANEELQSNNEELQSTNEELDTSREELQSLNEELLTLNSELQAKNDQLSKANDDLKNLLNRTDIAIIFLDDDLKIRRYTSATVEVFNLIDSDVGRPISDITSQLSYEKLVDDAREVLRTLVPREMEVQRKDGHWYKMRTQPYLTAQNVISGLVMSFLDINEQKEASARLTAINEELQKTIKALGKSEEQYRRIVETSYEGILVADTENRITLTNNRILDMLGYTAVEVKGKSLFDFVEEKDRSMLMSQSEERRKGLTGHYELKLRRKDGTLLWVGVSASPILEGGQFHGYLKMFTDITEHKLLDELKDEFIGMVSHELRTPLAILVGDINTALAEALPVEERRQLLSDAASAADSLEHILDNMLELARCQANRLSLNMERVNVSRAIRDGVKHMEREEHAQRVVVDIPSQPMVAQADKVRLSLILHNLLENAMKYSPEGSEIKISARRQNNEMLISVSDQGVGISPEDQEKLFQPFSRFSSTALPSQGVGLGLSVVRHLVEAQGGRIWVKSQHGKGSTFFFTIPADSQPRAAK